MNQYYFVYILTNPQKTTLYIGVTNDLRRRLSEHLINKKTTNTSFSGRYKCHRLVYFELFESMDIAIDREKQIKRWSRKKKERLIETKNPKWLFLNEAIFTDW